MGKLKLFSVYRDLRIDGNDKNSFFNQVTDRNINRLHVAARVVILLSLVYLIIFLLGLKSSTGLEWKWRSMIIAAHLLNLFLAVIIALTVGWIRKSEHAGIKYGQITVKATFVVYLLLGVIFSGIDQLVNAGIVPFIIISVALPLVLLVPVFFAMAVYIVAFIFFALVISVMQPIQVTEISLILNGLTSVTVGALLSILIWQQYVKQYRQSKLIDEQKDTLEKQNQQLEIVAEGLMHANETKDKFFSIISHDLRSPFNSIVGFSELIIQSLQEKDYEEVLQYTEIIRQSSDRAMELLTNLTEWSRTQTGRLVFDPKLILLSEVIEEISDLYGDVAGKKEIRFENNVDAGLKVRADRAMISTILRNLISNAIKFTPRGGRITITAERLDNELTIYVTDTGIGISEEMQEKLFLIDKNYSTKGTENEQGTGLGLILCREFVEKHGGTIGVKSDPGLGSRFYFTIPAKEQNED